MMSRRRRGRRAPMESGRRCGRWKSSWEIRLALRRGEIVGLLIVNRGSYCVIHGWRIDRWVGVGHTGRGRRHARTNLRSKDVGLVVGNGGRDSDRWQRRFDDSGHGAADDDCGCRWHRGRRVWS
jgi:hypothetical protein